MADTFTDSDKTQEQEKTEHSDKTSQEQTSEPQTTEEQQYPDWFQKDKYASIEEQAKAYSEAEKRMTQATQEAARLRRELEELKMLQQEKNLLSQNNNVPFGSLPGGSVSDDVRSKVEQTFGMPYEQVAGTYFLMKSILDSKDNEQRTLNETMTRVKSSLREQDPFFETYESEFDALVQTLPVSERLKADRIKSCVEQARGRKLPDIVASLEKKSRTTAVNVNPPKLEPAKSGSKGTTTRFKLTPEQAEITKRYGGNPDETEKFLDELEKRGL